MSNSDDNKLASMTKSVSKRAAIIAKAQATKNGPLVAQQSASERRSAQLKNRNYKPIMVVGNISKPRLEQMRKEIADKKAKEEEEEAAKVKEHQEQEEVNNSTLTITQEFQQALFKKLPVAAYKFLPENFPEMDPMSQLQAMIAASFAYKQEIGAVGQDQETAENAWNGEELLTYLGEETEDGQGEMTGDEREGQAESAAGKDDGSDGA